MLSNLRKDIHSEEGQTINFTMYAEGGNTQTENLNLTLEAKADEEHFKFIIDKNAGWEKSTYKSRIIADLTSSSSKIETDRVVATIDSDYNKDDKTTNTKFELAIPSEENNKLVLDVNGHIENLVKGTSFDYIIDKINLGYNDIPSFLTFSGKVSISTKDVSIENEELSNMETIDIFKVTLEEINALKTEVEENLNDFQNSLFTIFYE